MARNLFLHILNMIYLFHLLDDSCLCSSKVSRMKFFRRLQCELLLVFLCFDDLLYYENYLLAMTALLELVLYLLNSFDVSFIQRPLKFGFIFLCHVAQVFLWNFFEYFLNFQYSWKNFHHSVYHQRFRYFLEYKTHIDNLMAWVLAIDCLLCLTVLNSFDWKLNFNFKFFHDYFLELLETNYCYSQLIKLFTLN